MKTESVLEKVLASGELAVTGECGPPRGALPEVVKEKAGKNQELLTSLLNTDPGARYLGEWGIGTNYGISRFTKNMLFDEKIGGTIHLAVGLGFAEAGGNNESGLHWDMLCDMAEAQVLIDGELFYENGNPVI